MKIKRQHKLKTKLFTTLLIFISLISSQSSFSQVFSDSLLNDTSKNIIYILPGAEYMAPEENNMNIVKLVGNARFMHDSVFMRCDVGYIYQDRSYLKAIGNVRINQGDSLYLYGDSLNYDGETKIAIFRGNVRLEKNNMTLSAPSMKYDLNTNIAYYTEGGTVVSKKNNNTLTSRRGYYYSDFRKLSFKDDVKLTNPEYVMTSDTLDYDEVSEIAYFSGNTFIKGEGNLIFCKNGFYDTKNDISEFNNDAYLISDGHTIKGQKLYYDRTLGFGKAIGKVSLLDTANQVIVTGEYATRNEKNNTSLVTGNTLVSRWFDKGDTLFLTSDTIRLVKKNETNSLFCYKNVKFYKADLQGVCDSMAYLQSDSVLQMFNSPFIWSEESQMNGDTIYIQMANNKIKELNFRKNSFIIDKVIFYDSVQDKELETNQYNQIKGKNIKGLFKQDTIRTVFVNGNGESIYFTGEEGKRMQGVNKIICSDIEMRFDKSKLKNVLFITKPNGILIPIQDLKPGDDRLKGFEWKEQERPQSKDDISIKK